MADKVTKIEAGATYEEIGVGGEDFAFQNRHRYVGVRLVVSDTPPDPDHAEFFYVGPNCDPTLHGPTDPSFKIYARSEDPLRPVQIDIMRGN